MVSPVNENRFATWTLTLSKAYERSIVAVVALLPLLAIGYLVFFQDSVHIYVAHGFHEAAIFIAIAQTAFVAFVSWRCYVSSGEPLLRWFTLAFVGFAAIYAPHGAFTVLAGRYPWLFLLYGPVSRLIMATCLLAGIVSYGRPPDAPIRRTCVRHWLAWLALFIAIDLGVGFVALNWPESPLMRSICGAGADLLGLSILSSPTQCFRLLAESGALLLSVVGVALILRRAPRSPLMLLSAIALAFSAQASLAFIYAKAWEHLWWLAHFISAVCFTLLSYGIVRAYQTTRAFSLVFSQEEVMRQLAKAKTDAEMLAARLEQANKDLEVLAATDPLTKLSNRRHFFAAAQIEVARALRDQTSFCVLAIDLDHFKSINDSFGHAAGDAVLKNFAELAKSLLRPTDLIGRVGGEEFLIVLPNLGQDDALQVAERIRLSAQSQAISTEKGKISFTVSIGIAVFPDDGDRLESLCNVADECLYQAKHAGRNRSAGKRVGNELPHASA